MSEEIIANIPREHDNTVLEVALIREAGCEPRVELRTLIWGTGLGWYRGQTLTMDWGAARALIQSLSQAHRAMTGATVSESGRKVIPFPRRCEPQESATPQAVRR